MVVAFGLDITVPTDGGAKNASAVAAHERASDTIVGQNANGSILYTAAHGGAAGNNIQVEHAVGATGAGNENRALAVAWSGDDCTVTFGTDGAGASVIPTAQEIVDLLTPDPVSSDKITPSLPGDGTGLAGTGTTSMTGGADGGDLLLWEGGAYRVTGRDVF